MKKFILAVSSVFISCLASAEFSLTPPGPVEVVEPNQNQCDSGNMLTAIDSRLTPGAKAKYKTSNGGIIDPYKEVIWNLEVMVFDKTQFLQHWKVQSVQGVNPTEQELNTTYRMNCEVSACFSNVGDLGDIAHFSPCRLANGYYFGESEEDGYFTLKEIGQTIRAKKKVTGFEGELICNGLGSQYGQRINTMITSMDMPNHLRHSSCTPSFLVQKYEFIGENGKILHTVNNEMLTGDLKK